MLQQTQVATVIPYYRRFLRAFPSVESLAEAPLDRVLELWSGLGYYSRARRLQAAARRLAGEFAGRFPADFEAARSLPGVGRYTAAAVLSIAYGQPLAALDGNVARLVARLEGRPGGLADARSRRAAEQTVQSLLSRRAPGNFNQALMELGQTVCLPRSPRCSVCPLRPWCRGFRTGRPEAFPSPRRRRAPELHHLAAALVFQPAPSGHSRPSTSLTVRLCSPSLSKVEGRAVSLSNGESGNPNDTSTGRRVLMVRGLDEGLMTDLWNFPSAFGASPAAARARLRNKLEKLACGPVRVGPVLARLRHGITYRNIQVLAYRAEVSSRASAVSSKQSAENSGQSVKDSRRSAEGKAFEMANGWKKSKSKRGGNQELQATASCLLPTAYCFRGAAVSELARKIARAVGSNCRFFPQGGTDY
jgi:A/G-specific adenine glycosylase